jgi:DnaJ-domain-containing protein 1
MTRTRGGVAHCWRCGTPVPWGRVVVETVLHAREREAGGPYRTFSCPSCRLENGAVPRADGSWLLHPLEGLEPPGLLDLFLTRAERRRLLDAHRWWLENAETVERFRRGLDGAERDGREVETKGPRVRPPPPRRPRRVPAATGPRAVLGVPEDATPDEIRRAYRRAAKRLHPDRAPRDADSQDDAHRRFRAVRDAYETLLRDVDRV